MKQNSKKSNQLLFFFCWFDLIAKLNKNHTKRHIFKNCLEDNNNQMHKLWKRITEKKKHSRNRKSMELYQIRVGVVEIDQLLAINKPEQ